MMVLIEVLEILSVCRVCQVVLLFSILTVATIIESVRRETVVLSVLATVSILSVEIHVQAKILKTVNLVIYLKVTQQYIGFFIEGIVIYNFLGVARSIIVLSIGESRIILRGCLCPLPVATPVGKFLIIAHHRTGRVEASSGINSTLTSRLVLGVGVLGIDVHVQVVLQ